MKIIPNLSDIEILTPDGYKPFSAIAIENSSNTLIFELEDGRKISTSMGHLFVFKQKMTVAKDLKVGDFIDTVSGPKKIVNIKTGENMVHYGPLGVLGGLYLSNGIVNHNCQFIGSSTTLIAADALDQLTPSEPIDWKDGYALKIFENPQPGAMYLMGVDSANGSGKDYSVVQVIKIISKTKFEQVAVYACNTISAGKFSSEVKKISDMYNNALTIIENNEVGRLVADECWFTLEMQSILNTDDHGIGTRATKASKLDACTELKRVIENKIILLHDKDTIHELSIFEEVAPNVFKAPRNKHDDLVSALYWAIYATMQPQVDLDNVKIVKNDDYVPPQTFFCDDPYEY